MALFKKGENWYIDYYVQGRRKREKVGHSKRQAQLVLEKRLVQVAEGKFLDMKNFRKILLRDFAHTYIEDYSKPNKRSWTRDVTSLKHLLPFFGGKYLHEVTPLSIEQYKRSRMPEVSPRTINIELSCLRAMFNKAIVSGKTPENPVSQVKFLKEDDRRLRYLEENELEMFVGKCSSQLRPIVAMAFNTGMRKGEILNLKWDNVDLRRRIIYVLGTKTDEKREIPINSSLYTILVGLERSKKCDLVFPGKDGRPYIDIRKGFMTALRKSGIINFRFHDLRHTFASQLVMRGVDLKTVQELLGHKSIEMTLRYAHLSPGHRQAAVETLCHNVDTIWTPAVYGGQFESRPPTLTSASSKELGKMSACSSVDRTSASGAEGRRFESCQAHQRLECRHREALQVVN